MRQSGNGIVAGPLMIKVCRDENISDKKNTTRKDEKERASFSTTNDMKPMVDRGVKESSEVWGTYQDIPSIHHRI